MGSASVFFALQASDATLSDNNWELVETFRAVKNSPIDVHTALSLLKPTKRTYTDLRSTNPRNLTSVDLSARFIFLNRFCFNGLYRTNRLGEFNVPFSGWKTGRLPTRNELIAASKALANAEIHCLDFADALKDVSKNDFVFLDPPYWTEDRRVHVEYGPDTFTIVDFHRLDAILHTINDAGAKFILTYQECNEALLFNSSWELHRIQAGRTISCNPGQRAQVVELIVTNIPANNILKLDL